MLLIVFVGMFFGWIEETVEVAFMIDEESTNGVSMEARSYPPKSFLTKECIPTIADNRRL